MALTPRLDLRQSQSLVMTPQLQQAIKLLQMSNLELSDYVEQELEKNPLLERDGDDRHDDPLRAITGGGDTEISAGDNTGDGETLKPVDFDARPGDVAIETDNSYDVDYDNIYNNTGDPPVGESAVPGPGAGGTVPAPGPYSDHLPGLEETLSERPTLRSHLMDQLGMAGFDPVARLIGHHLIGMLDEAGYLAGDLEGLAETLGCEAGQVHQTLRHVQAFDPVGVFARDLGECLALQLRDRDRFDPAMEKLVDNLDLVAKREYTALSHICGVDMEDIVDMVDEIRALNPKPALSFSHEILQPVTPDVLMRPEPGGGWYLELNSENLPRILVNDHYYARISREAGDKAEREYIAERLQSANWLVKALHQRATTILKVATEIVQQQDMFFRKGVRHLRPIVLRNIAEAIEMHESTVSRVTSNKFMATPRGIYEFKYFFTSAIASSQGGDDISAESVRSRIRELVDAESPRKILSDDKLMEILRQEGMDVARRTIAKYRQSLGIGSSVQRRREKSAPR